jgi:hypothetical protein
VHSTSPVSPENSTTSPRWADRLGLAGSAKTLMTLAPKPPPSIWPGISAKSCSGPTGMMLRRGWASVLWLKACMARAICSIQPG